MKKLILIASALIFSFTSCDIKDEVESVINDNISPVEKEVSEDFSIPALVAGNQKLDPIKVDTSAINEEIDNVENASIEQVSIDDLEIAITTEGATFDFLNSIEIVIINAAGEEETLFNFDDIPEGATSLKLPEGTEIDNLKDLLEGDNFELGFNLDVKETFTDPIELELISNFLVQLGVNL